MVTSAPDVTGVLEYDRVVEPSSQAVPKPVVVDESASPPGTVDPSTQSDASGNMEAPAPAVGDHTLQL